MIINLPDTTSGAVGERLVRLRDEGGAVALGRVLTLLVVAGPTDVEEAVSAANRASREHPCRVVVIDAHRGHTAGLDAQIRVGRDAGAGEVIVLRPGASVREDMDTLVAPLLLPDAPVVAWWSSIAPEDPSRDPIGAMAGRRITDVLRCDDPVGMLRRLSDTYSPGDTDLSWARITMWRALLAAALDSPPFDPVTAVTVRESRRRPAAWLLAAWLAEGLRCPATVVQDTADGATTGVRLQRRSGPVSLSRPHGSSVATLEAFGGPPQRIVLPLRSQADALAEELRRLDPDETYGRTLTRGLRKVETP